MALRLPFHAHLPDSSPPHPYHSFRPAACLVRTAVELLPPLRNRALWHVRWLLANTAFNTCPRPCLAASARSIHDFPPDTRYYFLSTMRSVLTRAAFHWPCPHSSQCRSTPSPYAQRSLFPFCLVWSSAHARLGDAPHQRGTSHTRPARIVELFSRNPCLHQARPKRLHLLNIVLQFEKLLLADTTFVWKCTLRKAIDRHPAGKLLFCCGGH